ncbi:hypothetical protein LTR37_014222 [Vermiconidia calcicola]|uniref:Uncharacterized protein n=1 Tax=Vermiconidia calcicola TaxID=1690605 RepID=A0ACC3MUE1_9PEZI|nr:hypothetical protein LTR37_014222 [Vermiconidia calcicola]
MDDSRMHESRMHESRMNESRMYESSIEDVDDYYGTGVARTTDDSDYRPQARGDDMLQEPVLHEDQMDLYPADSVTGAVPHDIHLKSGRGLSPSFSSRSVVSNTIPNNGPGSQSSGMPSQNSSMPSQTSMPSRNSGTSTTVSKMPEFFSRTVFQIVLHNPTIAHQLLDFAHTRLCGENMEFLARVNKYHAMLSDVSKAIGEIHNDYISNRASSQINLPEQVHQRVTGEMRTALASTLPNLENIFVSAQGDIERLVYTDIYPKFVRHQMVLSAAKALGGDRAKYAGLGDCFVLTDPSKADNPIMYASDGFVKVTGYPRNEIIPRNCRFLQGRSTDRSAVRRLKAAIDKREESVELILNHKKNGEPFWNLLYTTPLLDGYGNLCFFLGGQINCSTTIHSSSDVMRILSQTHQKEEDPTSGTMSPVQPVVKQPRSRNIFNTFRKAPSTTHIPQRAPGMENTLLDKLDDMPLKGQMHTFYSAYSRFIVINYSTFLVSFVSAGILDLLFPIKATKSASAAAHAQSVGTDIFKFLANHGPSGSLSWEFKSSVKNALKMGSALTINLKLCARPYMGFEQFACHWTPLKDEQGAVSWVVLTLGNDRRA